MAARSDEISTAQIVPTTPSSSQNAAGTPGATGRATTQASRHHAMRPNRSHSRS